MPGQAGKVVAGPSRPGAIQGILGPSWASRPGAILVILGFILGLLGTILGILGAIQGIQARGNLGHLWGHPGHPLSILSCILVATWPFWASSDHPRLQYPLGIWFILGIIFGLFISQIKIF